MTGSETCPLSDGEPFEQIFRYIEVFYLLICKRLLVRHTGPSPLEHFALDADGRTFYSPSNELSKKYQCTSRDAVQIHSSMNALIAANENFPTRLTRV